MLQRTAPRFGLSAALLCLSALLFSAAAPAQTIKPVEGQDYQLIDPPVPTRADGKIEVVEVFGYSCSHCANFAPIITEWKESQPEDVKVEYVPAVFGGIWEIYARVYYTAEAMGVVDTTHDALFKALHTERRQIGKLEDIADFYAEHGVDKEQFLSTIDSFVVNSKIGEARTRVAGYGVEGTPTIIVAGKYRVMAPREGGYPRMLAVTDALIERERAANASAK